MIKIAQFILNRFRTAFGIKHPLKMGRYLFDSGLFHTLLVTVVFLYGTPVCCVAGLYHASRYSWLKGFLISINQSTIM